MRRLVGGRVSVEGSRSRASRKRRERGGETDPPIIANNTAKIVNPTNWSLFLPTHLLSINANAT